MNHKNRVLIVFQYEWQYQECDFSKNFRIHVSAPDEMSICLSCFFHYKII